MFGRLSQLQTTAVEVDRGIVDKGSTAISKDHGDISTIRRTKRFMIKNGSHLTRQHLFVSGALVISELSSELPDLQRLDPPHPEQQNLSLLQSSYFSLPSQDTERNSTGKYRPFA
jgi:hypothetical protein